MTSVLHTRNNASRRHSSKKSVMDPLDGVSILWARNYALNMLQKQIELATRDRVARDTPCSGDSSARHAILTFLPSLEIRKLFLETVSMEGGIERIRFLFGAPPYAFLHPEDAVMLNAQGFAHSRSNMAYTSMWHIPNYSQFGKATCVDEKLREFRIYSQRNNAVYDDLTGFAGIRAELIAGKEVELVCRLPRQMRKRPRDTETPMSPFNVSNIKLLPPVRNENLTLRNISSTSSDGQAVHVSVTAIRFSEQANLIGGRGGMPSTCVVRVLIIR